MRGCSLYVIATSYSHPSPCIVTPSTSQTGSNWSYSRIGLVIKLVVTSFAHCSNGLFRHKRRSWIPKVAADLTRRCAAESQRFTPTSSSISVHKGLGICVTDWCPQKFQSTLLFFTRVARRTCRTVNNATAGNHVGDIASFSAFSLPEQLAAPSQALSSPVRLAARPRSGGFGPQGPQGLLPPSPSSPQRGLLHWPALQHQRLRLRKDQAGGKAATGRRRMSVVNSAFAPKRAGPLGSCVPFKRFKATEVASYQSWEWRCKPLWLARRAPPPTLRTARRLKLTVSRRSEFLGGC